MLVIHKEIVYVLNNSINLSPVLRDLAVSKPNEPIKIKCSSREAVAFVMLYLQSYENLTEVDPPAIPITEPLISVFSLEFDVFGCLINSIDPEGTIAHIDKIMELVDILKMNILRDKLAAIAATLAADLVEI